MTAEVVLLATVLVVGLVVGAKSFRDAAVTEWADWAQAIANLDQSYNIPDFEITADVTVWGSHFLDQRDFCDTPSAMTSPAMGGTWNNGFTLFYPDHTPWVPPNLTVPATGEQAP